jgi:hypothetical protein
VGKRSNSRTLIRSMSIAMEGRRTCKVSVVCSAAPQETSPLAWRLALGQKNCARKLMEKNELYWDEQNVRGSERERRRREFSERYQVHIAAGDLYYPYDPYPYIEWYSDANGRVVLELDPSQVEIVGSDSRPKEKTGAELLEDGKKRDKAFKSFFEGIVKDLSRRNREQGGDDNVTGIVV